MVTLEVDEELMMVHTLYDRGSTISLVVNEVARQAGLLPVRVPRRMVRGFEGKETTIDSCSYLPLFDADGNVQVIRAYGVDDIVTVARSRPPKDAGDVFTMVRVVLPHMSMEGGPVELLIALDNTNWLPNYVEDSWQPDDDMRLMKSAFGHRYMIMGGWGTNLFPREPDWRESADLPEVQLEAYKSWSRSSWNQGPQDNKEGSLPRADQPQHEDKQVEAGGR
jgi:hypothetical protein